MRRDLLLLEQMIEAADQAMALVEGVAIQELAADRIRRDALLWNFTILGEASAQLSVLRVSDARSGNCHRRQSRVASHARTAERTVTQARGNRMVTCAA